MYVHTCVEQLFAKGSPPADHEQMDGRSVLTMYDADN